MFHPSLKDLTAEQLAGRRVVFIRDGLDESRLALNFTAGGEHDVSDAEAAAPVDSLITSLVKGSLLPSAQLWITTRPMAAHQIPKEYIDRVTELRGFSDDQKLDYFR